MSSGFVAPALIDQANYILKTNGQCPRYPGTDIPIICYKCVVFTITKLGCVYKDSAIAGARAYLKGGNTNCVSIWEE